MGTAISCTKCNQVGGLPLYCDREPLNIAFLCANVLSKILLWYVMYVSMCQWYTRTCTYTSSLYCGSKWVQSTWAPFVLHQDILVSPPLPNPTTSLCYRHVCHQEIFLQVMSIVEQEEREIITQCGVKTWVRHNIVCNVQKCNYDEPAHSVLIRTPGYTYNVCSNQELYWWTQTHEMKETVLKSD